LFLAGAAFSAEAEATPRFTVRTADGKTLQGPLDELSADWSLRLGGDRGGRVAGTDVLTLRRDNVAWPEAPLDDHLILTNGDRVPFRKLTLDGEKLHFRHPALGDGKEASVSLGTVAVIWLTAPSSTNRAEQFRRTLLTEARKRDVVVLRNGDRVEGVLNKLDADKLEIEVDKKMVPIKLPQVAVIALSTELAEKPKPKGTQGRLTLGGDDWTGGTRLTLRDAVLRDGALIGTTTWNAAVKVSLEKVIALDLAHGRAVYLSDLEPKEYESTPLLGEQGPRWPLGRDATADGFDLRLKGSPHDKGLGMHARSRVTYDMGSAYGRFEAVVGLDDLRGRRGGVRIAVLVDGKPIKLERDGELTMARGPLTLNVPIKNAKTLTLEVDFGARGGVEGVVDWIDARVVR
jgi:hypothetical protein